VGDALAPDAALGGDDHPIAHAADLLQDIAENFFSDAIGVNVRMIEQREAGFVSGDDRFAGVRFPLWCELGVLRAEHAPAAVAEAAGRD
jgi:hypothetical protein